MAKVATPRLTAVLSLLLAAGLVLGFLVVRAARADASGAVPAVQTAKSPTLDKTVLVSRKGLTLYSLSVERRGKFVCTDAACLSFWMPLVVAKGARPAGAPGLGTVRRPDGRLQVTFRGGPLYTFRLDRRRGDAKGEGIRDVGVWHAASPSSEASAPTPPPSPYGLGY